MNNISNTSSKVRLVSDRSNKRSDQAFPRILIFSTAYLPMIGGAEIAVKEITDRAKDYSFDLITARFSRKNSKQASLRLTSRRPEKMGNINIYRVGLGSKIDKYLLPILGYFKAKKLNKSKKYSLIWSISVSQAGLSALFFKLKNPKIPFLLTIQEGSSKKRLFQRRWIVWPLIKKIFKKADYIQAISRFLADFSKKMGAKCPVGVVPNGVNLEVFKKALIILEEDKQKLRNKLNIKPDEKVIITVSRLVPKNGIEYLIDAANILKKENINFKLLIIGTGHLRKKLELQATSYLPTGKEGKLQANILFLGLIPQSEVVKYLAISDVFVRPSISEGLGNVFLEAMAAGIPIIGTPVGGITDFLVDYNAKNANKNANYANIDVNGLFAKPRNPKDLADKISQLLEDDDLRKQLGENGRRLVEKKYDWSLITEKIKNIMRKLIHENNAKK